MCSATISVFWLRWSWLGTCGFALALAIERSTWWPRRPHP
jgi:hypothetical protein